MSGYFKELIGGTKSLFIGLGITAKYFMEPVVTMQYPHEHVEMPPRFRGHIELIPNEETGEPKCVACGMCQKGCPSGCISLAGEKREGVKGKVVTKYILNFTTCSLCGQCVESCKFGALRFSKDFNLASPRKEDFIFDLIKRLKEKN
ncbi:MAG: NADH-quinone oxidoreductase subunit I [Thermodesulfobacteriota bacterium]|jgi:NADH-quinone oxidoreductase subunit I